MPDESKENRGKKTPSIEESPHIQEDQEEIPQDVWDEFDDAMDKILKVPKKDQDIPNQQAG